MEITTPTNSSAPPSATKSPDSDSNVNGMGERPQAGAQNQQNDQLSADNIIMPAPAAAAAAIHQPKIVQTAFIHKLYKYGDLPKRAPCLGIFTNIGRSMLEDKSIQHLISWTPTSESFVMQPSHEFSKVLA